LIAAARKGKSSTMAKGDYLTPYQKGVVRRYYEHKGAMMHQKLAETVSELYGCTDARKAGRLWKTAQTALIDLGAPGARVDRLVAARDLDGLARLVGELF
jgi:hypothetical protein